MTDKIWRSGITKYVLLANKISVRLCARNTRGKRNYGTAVLKLEIAKSYVQMNTVICFESASIEAVMAFVRYQSSSRKPLIKPGDCDSNSTSCMKRSSKKHFKAR